MPRKTAQGRRSKGSGYYREDRQRWEGRVTIGYNPNGTQVRRLITAPTQKQLTERMREATAALEAGNPPPQQALTVAAFLNEWTLDVLPGSVAATTLQQYRDVVRLYIVPKVGKKKLAALNARDVARMLADLEADGKAPNTRRLARSVLRRALRWAEAEGLIARNAAAVAFGVKVPAPEGRTMTLDEARQFLTSVEGHRLEAAWVTMLTLGLRRGELLGLVWDDDVKLDAARPTLTVRRALHRLPDRGLHLDEPKTKGSRRTVHLPAPTVAALRAHRARQAEERLRAGPEWVTRPLGVDLVFRAAFGTPLDPDNFRNITYAVTEAAGVGRWSPHELRHVAASLLIALNVPLKTISETLGHSSIRVTADTYGHLLEDSRMVAADAMTEAFG